MRETQHLTNFTFTAMVDFHALHLTTVHESGKAETRWYDSGPGNLPVSGKAPKNFPSSSYTTISPFIPSPSVFHTLTTEPSRSVTALPTVGECAVHLELLEVFHQLRKRVISTTTLDQSFGVLPPQKIVYRRVYRRGKNRRREAVTIKDPTFPERSRAKWPIFLKIAVVRFLLWAPRIDKLMQENGGPPSEAQLPHLPPLGRLGPSLAIAFRDRSNNH